MMFKKLTALLMMVMISVASIELNAFAADNTTKLTLDNDEIILSATEPYYEVKASIEGTDVQKLELVNFDIDYSKIDKVEATINTDSSYVLGAISGTARGEWESRIFQITSLDTISWENIGGFEEYMGEGSLDLWIEFWYVAPIYEDDIAVDGGTVSIMDITLYDSDGNVLLYIDAENPPPILQEVPDEKKPDEELQSITPKMYDTPNYKEVELDIAADGLLDYASFDSMTMIVGYDKKGVVSVWTTTDGINYDKPDITLAEILENISDEGLNEYNGTFYNAYCIDDTFFIIAYYTEVVDCGVTAIYPVMISSTNGIDFEINELPELYGFDDGISLLKFNNTYVLVVDKASCYETVRKETVKKVNSYGEYNEVTYYSAGVYYTSNDLKKWDKHYGPEVITHVSGGGSSTLSSYYMAYEGMLEDKLLFGIFSCGVGTYTSEEREVYTKDFKNYYELKNNRKNSDDKLYISKNEYFKTNEGIVSIHRGVYSNTGYYDGDSPVYYIEITIADSLDSSWKSIITYKISGGYTWYLEAKETENVMCSILQVTGKNAELFYWESKLGNYTKFSIPLNLKLFGNKTDYSTTNVDKFEPLDALCILYDNNSLVFTADCFLHVGKVDLPSDFYGILRTHNNMILLIGDDMCYTFDGAELTIETDEKDEALKGDVNGDGSVTAIDARLALQAAAGNYSLDETATLAADVNGDGKVTSIDARLILQAAAGNIVL